MQPNAYGMLTNHSLLFLFIISRETCQTELYFPDKRLKESALSKNPQTLISRDPSLHPYACAQKFCHILIPFANHKEKTKGYYTFEKIINL